MGDLLEILPFTDPTVVVELDGETIWSALEGSLSKWPAQEGRFPILNGLRVEWDSRKPPNSRVLSVKIDVSADRKHEDSANDKPIWEDLKREKGGKMWRVVTRDYLAQGKDGFESLKGQWTWNERFCALRLCAGCKYLIDDESGLNMSTFKRLWSW